MNEMGRIEFNTEQDILARLDKLIMLLEEQNRILYNSECCADCDGTCEEE